jgi:hypothetical protein
MFKAVIIIGCLFLLSCAQHVNPSWQDGNLTKKEHIKRRLDRLENKQENTAEVLKEAIDPAW